MNKNDPPLNEPGLVFDDEIDFSAPVEKSVEKVTENVAKPKTMPSEPGLVLDVEDEVTPAATQAPVAKPVKPPPVEPEITAPVDTNESKQGEEIEFSVDMSDIPQSPQQKPVEEKATATQPSEQNVSDNAGANQSGEGQPKQRMGDQLISMGLLTADQLNVALQEQKLSGKMLGEVLVDLGFIAADELSSFLAMLAGFMVYDPKSTIPDADALAVINKAIAQKYMILPYSITDKELYVAISDPHDVVALDTLRKHIPKGVKVIPAVSTPQILTDAIDTAYGYASSVNAILQELEGKDLDELEDIADLSEEEAYSHPLVRLVNALIVEAVKMGASDLHFEPEEHFCRLRCRMDGVLSTTQILHKQHWNGISQRLKLMAALNIADKLTPQDGRIQMAMGGRDVDFRVSSLPTVFGENIVMRVLDKQSSIMPLSDLGFSDWNRDLIAKSQKRPEGIIIVTGPTGSGKTTSLYSMLNEINTVDVNIQTLEDPVEYSLPMIRQTQIKEGILDFADGIRALLRQDPDIIFIGEIRDKTTAEMALQSAMTGHQVYTTLHTNDSFGALPRLFDLGMVPGMVAGNIISIFAQRLARTLCENCKQPHKPTDEECQLLGVSDIPDIFVAKEGGCDQCKEAGYKGRTALAEILFFDEEMDEIVAQEGTKAELKALALTKGFKNMKDDGMLKILEGRTTFDAVSKVVDITK